jgi:hypothetical protein
MILVDLQSENFGASQFSYGFVCPEQEGSLM